MLASWAGGAAGLARRLLLGRVARKGEAELGCGEEMGQREGAGPAEGKASGPKIKKGGRGK